MRTQHTSLRRRRDKAIRTIRRRIHVMAKKLRREIKSFLFRSRITIRQIACGFFVLSMFFGIRVIADYNQNLFGSLAAVIGLFGSLLIAEKFWDYSKHPKKPLSRWFKMMHWTSPMWRKAQFDWIFGTAFCLGLFLSLIYSVTSDDAIQMPNWVWLYDFWGTSIGWTYCMLLLLSMKQQNTTVNL